MVDFKKALQKKTAPPAVLIPQTDKDFLWSIRLGKSLRVYSIGQPYLYQWVIWDGRFREEEELWIPCAPDQCVLGSPDTEGKSKFWVMAVSVVEEQMREYEANKTT